MDNIETDVVKSLGLENMALEDIIGLKFRVRFSDGRFWIGTVTGMSFGGIVSFSLHTSIGNFYKTDRGWATRENSWPVTFTWK
jgi:hypothetical protein